MKALEEHGSDFNAAMKSLYSLVSAEEKKPEDLATGGANDATDAVAAGAYTPTDIPPASGDDWVELLVREVTQSTGTDDAKVRAARVLEALEKMLSARAREEAGKKFQEVKRAFFLPPLNPLSFFLMCSIQNITLHMHLVHTCWY